jgi:peptide/nickel transport system permease protein
VAPLMRLWRHPRGRLGMVIVGALLVIAGLGPMFIERVDLDQNLSQAMVGSSADHWLGTDQVGRDYLARLILGLRTSWAVALSSTLLAMALGVAAGLLAGYAGGAWEGALLRLMDVVLAVPNLVLALVIAALIGPGSLAVVVTLILRGFPAFVRVSHATTKSLVNQEFVQGGIVLGASPARILLSYLLPNVLAPSFTLLPIMVGGGLLIAASLSFFGLGVQPPTAELGLLVAEGRRFMHLLPMLLWAPGLLLTVNNIGLSLLSDGLRVALDPTQRERSS